MADKKLKKIEKCSYCGKESNKLIKVGPKLRYCNYENCYAKDCLKKHPGTPLANIMARYLNEKIQELGKEENVSNLKKAIFALLYDQYDVPDIELKDSDYAYVDYIIGALIKKNENICPYKNYDCIDHCDIRKDVCI